MTAAALLGGRSCEAAADDLRVTALRPRPSRRTTSPPSTRARPSAWWSASASAPATTSTRGCWPRHIVNAHSRQPDDHRAEPARRRQRSTMTNALYNNGPFDGTVIGASFNGMPTYPLLHAGGGARFDPVKLNWLGNTNRETHVTYVWHTSPVQSSRTSRPSSSSWARRRPAPRSSISGWSPTPVRLQVQGDDRLRAHRRRSISRWRAARSTARSPHWSTLSALNSQWLNEKKIQIIAQWALRTNPDLPACRSASISPRPTTSAPRMQLCMARLDIRPAVLPAAERAGRAGRGAARGLRRHHEGPGLSGRGRPSSRSRSIR